jgi:hypothetical protein
MYGQPPITREYLQDLARSAASDFLTNGTPLTDAVVKQASACGVTLTAEHVRRICEMTYHDTYERMHKQASGADRYIVFDPPDAVKASKVLRAEKVASTQTRATPTTGGLMTEKSASAPARHRFQPANAFDQVLKTASADHAKPFSKAQGLRDLKNIHDALKEAASSIEAEKQASDSALLVARQELSKIAYSLAKDGVSADDILHAGFSGVDWDSVSEQSAVKVASELSSFLLSKEASTSGLRLTKTASAGDVNPEHPLLQAFAKTASIEERRVHLEIGLSQIKSDLRYANEALTSALFGEKSASVSGLLRGAKSLGKSAVQISKEHPVLSTAAGATAVGLTVAAARKLDPRNAPGGGKK